MKSLQEQHHVVCIIIIRTFCYHVPRYPLVALLVLFHDRDTKGYIHDKNGQGI